MVRYILIGLTLLLAADDFSRSAYAGTTVAGHAMQSLAYAFSPALFALVLAGVTKYWRLWRGRPDIFTKDFVWCWTAFLAFLYLAHFRSAIGIVTSS